MEPAGPRQPIQPSSGKSDQGKKTPSPPKEVKAAQEALKKKAESEDIVIGAPTGFRKVTGQSPDQPKPVKPEPAVSKPAGKISESDVEGNFEQEFVHMKDFAMGDHKGRAYRTKDAILPVIFALQFHPELGNTEGVFRLSGDNQKKENLIAKLLEEPHSEFEELKAGNLPVTVLTDTIKSFLKELNPRLLETQDSFEKIDRIVKMQNPQDKLQAVVHYINALSQDQKIILLKLLTVTDIVIKNQERTKMAASNLATTPGPLLTPDVDPNAPNFLEQMRTFSAFAKLLFENSSDINKQVTF